MTRARTFLLWSILSCLALAGCGALATEDSTHQAIDDARSAGLTPYWLGESFEALGVRFQLAETKANTSSNPSLILVYYLDGGGTVWIMTCFKQNTNCQRLLDGGRNLPGVSVTDEQVGNWAAKRWEVPLGSRPVSKQMYLLQTNGMEIIAIASSGSTGVPGSDVNPFIDAALWAQVLEDHLQPYPE